MKKLEPPRMRIYLTGVGWLCNKLINEHGCKKIKYHKDECKHSLSLWEKIKRQFQL